MKTLTPSNDTLLRQTPLLDFQHEDIQQLVAERKWNDLSMSDRAASIYTFVRDEILFGYNRADEIPASEVLRDGYGQCNTKATLLMALFRAVHLPCRFHGFTIDKALQKGAITGIWYRLAPQEIVHSWVEVELNGRWIFLEGVILDLPYLTSLQMQYPQTAGQNYCGYGACTPDINNPPVDFNEEHTYIQAGGIVRDFGLYNDPDSFYSEHKQDLSRLKQWLFVNWIRHSMNGNVQRIRASGRQPS